MRRLQRKPLIHRSNKPRRLATPFIPWVEIRTPGSRPALRSLNETGTLLRDLAALIRYQALDALLQDSRIKWEFTDGRAYILRSGKQFNVI
jgi:hypothetical protein